MVCTLSLHTTVGIAAGERLYFVDTYPDHYLAKDTRTTLQYLELTPEEMLAEILAGATDENLVME